jgi:hypothetical protein
MRVSSEGLLAPTTKQIEVLVMMETLFYSPLFLLLAPLLVALVLFIIALVLWQELKKRPDTAVPWVEPYLYEAIIVAYKASEAHSDAFGQRLRGADKAAIARVIYREHFPAEYKIYLSEAAFTTAVERLLGEGISLYEQNKAGLEQAFAEWQQAQNEAGGG